MENLKTYSYDEAYEASLKYFDGDELAARVWVNKYVMKDSFGNIFEKSPVDPLQEEENLFAEAILRGDLAPRDHGAEAVELAGRILTACRKNGTK